MDIWSVVVNMLICVGGWKLEWQWMAAGHCWTLWGRESVCCWSSLRWATSAACSTDEETHWCTVRCHPLSYLYICIGIVGSLLMITVGNLLPSWWNSLKKQTWSYDKTSDLLLDLQCIVIIVSLLKFTFYAVHIAFWLNEQSRLM